MRIKRLDPFVVPAPIQLPSFSPVIEIDFGGAHMWIWRGADIRMMTAIVRALKGSKAFIFQALSVIRPVTSVSPD